VNERDKDPGAPADPQATFRALGFPEDIVKLAHGADEAMDCSAAVEASSPTDTHAGPSSGEILVQTWLQEHNLLLHENLKDECAKAESSSKSGVVAGFIPRRAVSFLIGDSGIGKSPLAYQLGLSVAAGVPFLGMETQAGLVVMCDYENGMEESLNLSEQVARFLGILKVPHNFAVWSPDHSNGNSMDIQRICESAPERPRLIIVDSLRSHDAHFEKHEHAAEKMNQLNRVAYKSGAAILVIHHTRKPNREHPVPDLSSDDTRVMEWLKETAGGGSLINQSHTRIAVGSVDGRSHLDAVLILRWYRKSKGEAGPLYLERICDADGEPFGYRPLTEIKLLGNPDQETAFHNLPPQFTFKEAKQTLKRTDDPTSKFLKKCISLSLVRQTGRGRYERTDAAGGTGSEASADR
jgi:KaiC/GvpD/RAD55 family RecA-like ATPase